MQWSLALNFFIALLAIANPLGKVPLWVEAAGDELPSVRWRLAVLLVATATVILWLFLVFGASILNAFDIELASFKVGGGVVILVIGMQMLNGRILELPTREENAEDTPAFVEAQLRYREVVVPMAVPMIAGPGAITTVIIYGTSAEGPINLALLSGVLAVVMGVMLVLMLLGVQIRRLIGYLPLNVTMRLFGLILAAIAAQLIIEGLGQSFPAWIG